MSKIEAAKIETAKIETAKIETVRCPNCGSHAERHYLLKHQIVQTQCPSCDYLMINCARTGSVVEAYAPGIAMS